VDGDTLTGRLLVSTPQIAEGVFHRSVVLLLHHDEDGAQGIILNRPMDAEIEAVLPGWQEHATKPQRLFQGGPVGLDSALGLVTVPGAGEEPLGVKRLFGGIALVDLDVPPVLVIPEIAGLRIFAGFAGWSPGQLEVEIHTGSWYVVDAEARDAFTDDPAGMWVRVLRRQRDPRAFAATFPVDPSMN
jgi:putative transcriptional regulator